MIFDYKYLRELDPELYEVIKKEEVRQEESLELIASENFVSRAIMEAAGTVLTNKYAEGYPGRRYYGGCEFVDIAENLARDRALELFGGEHANVQPHSGSQANMAVYLSVLDPGDTVMGMDLAHGGHLTHGSPVNFSGRLFYFVHYGVNRETELLDYEAVREQAHREEPDMIVAGASAYSRLIEFDQLAEIADEIGAYLLVDMAHIAGMVAVGLHPNPVPHSDFVTSTTHKTLRGPRGGLIVCPEEFARDVDKALFPGTQGGPLMHIIAAKAAAFLEALKPEFHAYQEQILKNARALANGLMDRDLRVVSGGTDNHLMLVDVSAIDLTGREAEDTLDRIGITVNKNTIPFDEKSPQVTSGIRLGTPAVTTRGMKEEEMDEIAELIYRALESDRHEDEMKYLRSKVKDLCGSFPLYKE